MRTALTIAAYTARLSVVAIAESEIIRWRKGWHMVNFREVWLRRQRAEQNLSAAKDVALKDGWTQQEISEVTSLTANMQPEVMGC